MILRVRGLRHLLPWGIKNNMFQRVAPQILTEAKQLDGRADAARGISRRERTNICRQATALERRIESLLYFHDYSMKGSVGQGKQALEDAQSILNPNVYKKLGNIN
ncbi:MAG: hypothetical protein SFU25_04890 [Candidatus Caenarcaniphilales bacterium]|nr:hypothetical protein [Candidatus Caenarcaniphilales bacterium]